MKRASIRETPHVDHMEFIVCPNCGKKCFINLRNSENIICSFCCFDISACDYLNGKEKYSKRGKLKETPDFNTKTLNRRSNICPWGTIILSFFFICLFIFIIFEFLTRKSETKNLIKELRSKYPSQKEETWYHISSVLETEVPNVKTIILLHENREKKTVDCLTRHLLQIYSKNNEIKIEDVSFKRDVMKFQEYGEVLEYYHPIIKEHKVFAANLSEVPSNIARIFHTLCDEISSDIKPSLFIFALQYENQSDKMKPLQRATTILEESWKDLAGSDMYPLLARVAKNVVDIQHEEKINCDPFR